MKKIIVVLLVLSSALTIAWQNRVNILVWGAPKLSRLFSPVAPNRDIHWQQGPVTAAAAPSERPPNIILIMTDDMGFNDISLYNGAAAGGHLQTPNIDALAHQGVRFDNGYAANAVCAPSRAAAMTGRYSTRFGFEFTPFFKLGATIFNWMEQTEPGPLPVFIDKEKADALPELTELGMPTEEITIAEVLKQKGYYTAHIGKWHLGSVGGMRPTAQGFDDSLELSGTLYLPEDHPDVVNAKIPGDGIDRMVWATGKFAARFNSDGAGEDLFQPAKYLTDYYTDEAVKVIESNRHRPFFLYLAHWGPHNPLQATREDYEALSHIQDHGMRVYAGMLRALDRSVKRVTETLEQHGLTDNTLIIFTSDNGGANYVRLPGLNKPFRGWKLSHFEGGFHVPYLMKWPAALTAGTTFKQPIHHIDLMHTVAAAAGANQYLPGDRKLDGVDLVPYVQGSKLSAPHDTLFWREGYQQTVLHKGWKLIRSEQPEKPPGTGLRRFLFNLNTDPTEQRNLLDQRPEKVTQLEALLAAHNAEQIEPLWPSVMQSPQMIDKQGGEPYVPGDTYLYWPN